MSSQISPHRRFQVFNRDSFRCFYCGADSSRGLVVDHVVPRALGGTNDRWNLVTACGLCNHGKSDRVIDEAVIREIRTRDSLFEDRAGGMCEVCRCPLPRPLEDEDPPGPECVRCNDILYTVWEQGKREAA